MVPFGTRARAAAAAVASSTFASFARADGTSFLYVACAYALTLASMIAAMSAIFRVIRTSLRQTAHPQKRLAEKVPAVPRCYRSAHDSLMTGHGSAVKLRALLRAAHSSRFFNGRSVKVIDDDPAACGRSCSVDARLRTIGFCADEGRFAHAISAGAREFLRSLERRRCGLPVLATAVAERVSGEFG